jgi:hypothetical protein
VLKAGAPLDVAAEIGDHLGNDGVRPRGFPKPPRRHRRGFVSIGSMKKGIAARIHTSADLLVG